MINIRPQTSKQPAPAQHLAPVITVIGVGGAGGNAVRNMIEAGLEGVQFMVCNTDAQALAANPANQKIQLGLHVTGGLGAGTKPELGRAAAEEALADIMKTIEGSHMVFITSGMGGGTGTGGAPVIAKACKDAGILTVGVVTKPFHFEGPVCMRAAEAGIQEMQKYVDTLIVIPNQNLFRIANERTTFQDACKLADHVLQSAVRGVTDLMVMPGLVNLDFNDIKTTMTAMGKAMMGTGEASGERRAVMAADAAINNPLLDDVTMKGAKGVIINIAGGSDMTLFEIDEACNRIRSEVDTDASIIFGTSIDENLNGALRVTVVATGIDTAAASTMKPDQTTTTAAVATKPAVPRAFSYGAARANINDVRPVAAAPVAPAVPAAPVPHFVQAGAFIPPAPVEYDQVAAFDRTMTYDQIQSGLPLPADPGPDAVMVDEPQPVMVEPKPVVQQPVPATPEPVAVQPTSAPALPPGAYTRRAPATPVAEPALTLFQRITQRVRVAVENAFDDRDDDMMAAAPMPVHAGAQAPRVQPVVTTQAAVAAAPVDMAKPAKAPSAQPELDLEIPAFLRRQAS